MSNVGKPLRVALVNDHIIVIRGLAAMLENHRDRIDVVELDALRDPPRDVDVVLKDAFGMVDDLRDFVDTAQVPVVVFAFSTDQAAVRAAFDAGVAGYVYKGVDEETLVAAWSVRTRASASSSWTTGSTPPTGTGPDAALSSRIARPRY